MDVVTSPVGVRELKARLSAYLAAVEAGQEVIVTDRGRPVARLSPVLGGGEEGLQQLIAEGRVIPPRTRERWLPSRPVKLGDGTSIVDFVRDQRR